MASDARTPSSPLDELEGADQQTVRGLDFYQALRRLECTHRRHPRLAEAVRSVDEPVRLGQRPHLSFESAAVVEVQQRDPLPPRVEVSFFGAFGPNGPLPLHLTEYAQQRILHGRDRSLAAFVDIFHHRLLTFFYRAWANAQPTVQLDRPESDRFSKYVGSVMGQGSRTPSRDRELDQFCLLMAGHFANGTRHPEGLTKILSAYFEAPARVEEFVGDWLRLPDEYCWRLNNRPNSMSEPLGRLGSTSRVGRRIWDRQYKFRVVMGPLTKAQYEELMPGGKNLARLIRLVRRYAGVEQAWDLQLIMRDPDIEPTLLGRGARIGRSAFLVRETVSRKKVRQDFIFDPLAQAG